MTNLFLIHTEYHLMLTIRLVSSCFSDDENHVYYTLGRLNQDLFKKNQFGLVFHELPRKDYGVRDVFDGMSSLNPSRFLLFQDNSSDNIYLLYRFHRRGVTVSLVQDGYKPYPVWHRKHLPLVIVKETFALYHQMFRRHAIIPSFFLVSYKYGSLRYIDELWLEYPDKLPYLTKKQLCLIPSFTNDSLSKCLSLFEYTPDIDLNNVVLYIGQPLRGVALRKRELEIMGQIINLHRDKLFIYRPHPLQLKEQVDEVVKLDGISLYDRPIPIELLMVSLHDSIIISPWSTALLTNNDSCRYYWLYNLMSEDESIGKTIQMEFVNPTHHIIEVNSIQEII